MRKAVELGGSIRAVARDNSRILGGTTLERRLDLETRLPSQRSIEGTGQKKSVDKPVGRIHGLLLFSESFVPVEQSTRLKSGREAALAS